MKKRKRVPFYETLCTCSRMIVVMHNS